MNYNQESFNQNYKEYSALDKKNNITITKVILLVLSIVHFIYGYPILKDVINENLINANIFSSDVIKYIVIGYYYVSILFILITAWNIAKTRYFLRKIYIVGLLVALVSFGYTTYKNNNEFKNAEYYPFMVEVKNIYDMAKSQWKYDAKGFPREITYAKVNGSDCKKHLTVVIGNNTNYLITLNNKGKVILFKVTDGKYQYDFKGVEVTNIKDMSKDVSKVTDDNKVIISSCPNTSDF